LGRKRTAPAALVTVLLCAGGCSHSSSGSSGGGSIAAPIASTQAPLAAPAVFPLICVHGIQGDPDAFASFEVLQGGGRALVPALYAAEADKLTSGSLPAACVVAAGYYKESTNDTKYEPDASGVSHGSIGGIPLSRQDSFASGYTQSYVERLGRIVDGVRRATGSDRVDLVLHSMGNMVGRAYVRWHSSGAAGGTSKVRRVFLIAGPQRGLNAVEGLAIGWDLAPDLFFMREGEILEMCHELPVFQGQSFPDALNDGWDTFCQANDVAYAGISGTNAHGQQVDPQGSPVKNSIATIVGNIVTSVINPGTAADLKPYADVCLPKILPEAAEALGPSDGVIRLALSRLDQAPFARTVFWAPLELRHEGGWNPEQSCTGSTATVELARIFFEGGSGGAIGGTVRVLLEDSPGKASWIAVETTASGDTASVQLVEETLDASGNPVGGAFGYGCPIAAGAHRVFFQVPSGGGSRRYHAVLYGTSGAVTTADATFTLTQGSLDTPPTTTFSGATTSTIGGWPSVHATFATNAAATDTTAAFSFRMDGGAWGSPGPASFDTPPLGPGEHRLEARARHSTNGPGLLCEDTRGVAIGLLVDASGAVTVRR
jgi:pimeloyl-ACP methyl ester carboxylesterase